MVCFYKFGKPAIIHTCPLKIQWKDYSVLTYICAWVKKQFLPMSSAWKRYSIFFAWICFAYAFWFQFWIFFFLFILYSFGMGLNWLRFLYSNSEAFKMMNSVCRRVKRFVAIFLLSWVELYYTYGKFVLNEIHYYHIVLLLYSNKFNHQLGNWSALYI